MSSEYGFKDKWVEQKRGEWWLMQTDKNGDLQQDTDVCVYPASAKLSFGAHEDGKPYSTTCFHYYEYCNGSSPAEVFDDDDVSYLHICNIGEFIERLQNAKDTIGDSEYD